MFWSHLNVTRWTSRHSNWPSSFVCATQNRHSFFSSFGSVVARCAYGRSGRTLWSYHDDLRTQIVHVKWRANQTNLALAHRTNLGRFGSDLLGKLLAAVSRSAQNACERDLEENACHVVQNMARELTYYIVQSAT